jgi:excisionase family DNA binding protein
MNKIYTTKQVAEMFGLHEKGVAVACRRGNLEAQRFGRAYLITEQAIGEWVRTHRTPSRLKWTSEARQFLSVWNDARQLRELADHICNLCAPV